MQALFLESFLLYYQRSCNKQPHLLLFHWRNGLRIFSACATKAIRCKTIVKSSCGLARYGKPWRRERLKENKLSQSHTFKVIRLVFVFLWGKEIRFNIPTKAQKYRSCFGKANFKEALWDQTVNCCHALSKNNYMSAWMKASQGVLLYYFNVTKEETIFLNCDAENTWAHPHSKVKKRYKNCCTAEKF